MRTFNTLKNTNPPFNFISSPSSFPSHLVLNIYSYDISSTFLFFFFKCLCPLLLFTLLHLLLLFLQDEVYNHLGCSPLRLSSFPLILPNRRRPNRRHPIRRSWCPSYQQPRSWSSFPPPTRRRPETKFPRLPHR